MLEGRVFYGSFCGKCKRGTLDNVSMAGKIYLLVDKEVAAHVVLAKNELMA